MDLPTNTLRGKLILDGGSLAGSFFHRSVLLICQHDEEGAFGLILNRPLSPPPATASPFKLPNSLKNHSIFVGGPVQPGALSFLMTDAFIDTEEILPGIALGHHLEDLEEWCQHYSPQKSFRLFSGYAGWSPGQLDDEVSKGAWLIHPGNKKLIFDHPPQSLWRDIMSQMGWEERLQATAPDDLSEN